MLEQVTAFLAALEEESVDAREERFEQNLQGGSGTWSSGPVFDRLAIGVLSPRRGGPWPRGAAVLVGVCLPCYLCMPQALRETELQECRAPVVDRMISVYTPTVRALLHARRARHDVSGPQARTADGGRHIVAVAMPHTPGQRDLSEADDEAAGLHDRFPGQVTVVAGPSATYEAVVSALPWRAGLVHFACHGSSDLTSPSDSTLLCTTTGNGRWRSRKSPGST